MLKKERNSATEQIENTAKTYEDRLKANEIAIILCDNDGETIALLGHKRSRRHSIYKLVLGHYTEQLEDNTYDTYFFENTDELTQILDFITEHPEIFRDTTNIYDAVELTTKTTTETEDYVEHILSEDEQLEELAHKLDFWTF